MPQRDKRKSRDSQALIDHALQDHETYEQLAGFARVQLSQDRSNPESELDKDDEQPPLKRVKHEIGVYQPYIHDSIFGRIPYLDNDFGFGRLDLEFGKKEGDGVKLAEADLVRDGVGAEDIYASSSSGGGSGIEKYILTAIEESSSTKTGKHVGICMESSDAIVERRLFQLPRAWQNYGKHCPDITAEEPEQLIQPKRHILILHGFEWGNQIVKKPFIQEILNRCTPVSLEFSTEVSGTDLHSLRTIYGISTEFVKIELGSVDEKTATTEALMKMQLPSCCPGSRLEITEHNGFSNLIPATAIGTAPTSQNPPEIIAVSGSNSDIDVKSPDAITPNTSSSETSSSGSMSMSMSMSISSDSTTSKHSSNSLDIFEVAHMASPTRKDSPIKTAPIKTELSNTGSSFQDRKQHLPLWINLAKAVAEARSQLQGEDLKVFEALIAKPQAGADQTKLWERFWGSGLVISGWRGDDDGQWV